jgi:hypothetical protein
MRLVQLARGSERRVAVVEGEHLRLASPSHNTVYALAQQAIETGHSLVSVVERALSGDELEYETVYRGASPWRLLPSFDHPAEPARCLVSGTGLTHKASAENRAAMHKGQNAEVTDSFRMYQMGLEGGNPPEGQIGVQPEWFYKGTGLCLRAHNDALEVPAYGWDGGEEPEIAGVYVIAPDGMPRRVGLTVANEFSDHRMEKKNYLYLAPSKLRQCSIGPELTIGGIEFGNLSGTVTIFRDKRPVWSKEIFSGQQNMSHSLANLEHHHFKYEVHRRPGDAHVHFFGADAFSFGDGVVLEAGDVMEISFPAFGRPLRNRIVVRKGPEEVVIAKTL